MNRQAQNCNQSQQRDPLTYDIIGAAIEVHRELGPGLLESAYEECLCFELMERGLQVNRQVSVPIVYKRIRLDCGYRIDLLIENEVIVELKTVDTLSPVHEAQLLTYMKLCKKPKGLLINFHSARIMDGMKRLVLSEFSSAPL